MVRALGILLLLAAMGAMASAVTSGPVWVEAPMAWATVPAGMPPVVQVMDDSIGVYAVSADHDLLWWGFAPAPPMSLTGVRRIVSLSYRTKLALLVDGTVVAWDGSGVVSTPPGLTGVVDIAASGGGFFAVHADGTVTAWGGALSTLPPGLANVRSIAVSDDAAVAVLADDSVVAWGSPSTATPALSNVRSVALASWGGLALHTDGTVEGWGTLALTMPSGLAGVTAISVSSASCIVVRGDGSVVQWGTADEAAPALTTAVAATAGVGHMFALLSDGSVVGWGRDVDRRRLEPPAGLGDAIAVDAAFDHVAAVMTDGTVRAWGESYSGTCTVPAGLSGVTAISVGGAHALALKSDGTVVYWGQTVQFAGPYFSPTGVTAIASGWQSMLALKSDGTVVGYNASSIPAMTGVTAIAAEDYSFAAIDGAGTVHVWGTTQTAGLQTAAQSAVCVDGLGGFTIDPAGTLRQFGALTLLPPWATTMTWPSGTRVTCDFGSAMAESPSGDVYNLLVYSPAGPHYRRLHQVVQRQCPRVGITAAHEPRSLAVTNLTVPEDAPVGTVVGTATAVDDDPGASLTFSRFDGYVGGIPPGPSPQPFAVNPDGDIVVAAPLDYESRRIYPIGIIARDDEGYSSGARIFLIRISDVVEPGSTTGSATGGTSGAATAGNPGAGGTSSGCGTGGLAAVLATLGLVVARRRRRG